MHQFLLSDTHRTATLIIALIGAVGTMAAGITSIGRMISAFARRARLKRETNLELATKSVHFLSAYTFDHVARSLPILAYSVVLVLLGTWFATPSEPIADVAVIACLAIGAVFFLFGVIQLWRLSGFLSWIIH